MLRQRGGGAALANGEHFGAATSNTVVVRCGTRHVSDAVKRLLQTLTLRHKKTRIKPPIDKKQRQKKSAGFVRDRFE